MDSERASEWSPQLRLACQALSRSEPGPAMAIEVAGSLVGPRGQALTLVMATKGLAAQYGLRYEASMKCHTLTVRLSRAAVAA